MKFLSFLSLTVILSTMFVFNLYAKETKEINVDIAIDEVLISCSPTVRFEASRYPGDEKIGTSNNLRRETGSGYVAEGEPIYIMGRVVDEDCLPVADAEVFIWQPNEKGEYVSGEINPNAANFLGSGRTTTNNAGTFEFLSIFPGTGKNLSAPHVNVMVRHPEFDDITTRMYFPEQVANDTDADLKKLNAKEKKRVTAVAADKSVRGTYPRDFDDALYVYDITLPGKNRFKRY